VATRTHELSTYVIHLPLALLPYPFRPLALVGVCIEIKRREAASAAHANELFRSHPRHGLRL
jgi:hypothetical protein